MIEIRKEEDCCGCQACFSACPKNCIKMVTDQKGFSYPVVDENVCVQCGKCENVCPIQNKADGNVPLRVFGATNQDREIRKSSSSGGTFFLSAKDIIDNGGVVFGCALDENMVARHMAIDAVSALHTLQNSKYVQSDIGDTYRQAKEYLSCGKQVLYSGTPCQIAGLKNYLGKEYDNLLLVDLLCHGVPSPKMFGDYLGYLSDQYKGKPVFVNFRNKKKGWKRLYFEVLFDNGKRYFTYSGYDRYMSMFLNNISLRPSCYACVFASNRRQGDVTLGDFWGIGKKYPQKDDDKGISLILLNTQKGGAAFERIKSGLNTFESTIDEAKVGQKTLSTPTAKNPKHDEFYCLYAEKGIKKAVETTVKVPSVFGKAYYAVMRWTLALYRKIFKKGY